MAYNGDSKKIVSSSFLFSTLQTFYTKIKGLLDNKITNNPFVGSGTSGKSGYIAFAQLVITSSYTNRPIEFELICRGRATPCYVSITFANGDTKDPTLSSLSYFGTDYGVFAQKTDASTWLLYHTKSESYDNITVTKIQGASQGVTITHPGTFITEKPTENVTDAALGYRVGYSAKTTSDSDGQQINTTYIKGLSVSGKTITYTKGDNTTGTITTQDTNTTYSNATTSAAGLMSASDKSKLDGIASGANAYSLPTASSSTLGGVKTTSTVTSNSGYTACPIISGVPYYKDTNTTYSLSSFGITATAAELNALDGITSTVTELNYCDGVTSNIQTQLNGKASSSHTHNYAGSSSAGGAATTALACTGNSATATNADKLDGYHADSFVKLSYAATTDWNTLTEGGMYRIDDISSQTSRHDEMGSYGQLLVVRGTGDTIFQLYGNYANNKIFSRTANGVGGTQINWTSWNKINDGGHADIANTATTSSYSNNLNSTGFGSGTLTYLQTSGDFYDNTGWCHYIIANHGDGATYYNHTIALPFWDVPMYQRQEGNTSSRRGWQKFYTTENITYGTSALTPGSSSLKTGHIYLQYE